MPLGIVMRGFSWMKFTHPLWLGLLALFILSGCRTGKVSPTYNPPLNTGSELPPPPPIPEERPIDDGDVSELGGVLFEPLDGRYLTSDEAEAAFAAFQLERLDPSVFDLPLVVTDQVLLWMLYFAEPAQGTYERWVARSAEWGPMILSTLAEEGLPSDLLYLSMIESGFKPKAVSPASAAGLWQFMRPTARAMGLTIDNYVDERMDPVRSTQAAARYITYLYKRFDDWYLAMAAYNGGEGRVSRAIKRTGTMDYWALCEQKELPTETCNYVPKILAAMVLGDDPSRYGFQIDPETPMVYDTVEVPGGVSLEVVALCADSDLDELLRLNPELRRPFTPPGRSLYPTRVPLGSSEGFLSRFDDIPQEQKTGVIHVVASGENPWTISRTYGITVDDLLRANDIQDAKRIQIGAELVIPGFGAVTKTAKSSPKASPSKARKSKASTSAKSSTTASAASAPRGAARVHAVGKGESLWSISQAYGISMADLKSWNGLSSNTLQIGQPLKIYGVASGGNNTYTVKAGDSLWSIARGHGMSVEEIKHLNGLRSDRLKPGDTLRVRAGNGTGQARYHTVKKGENLWVLSRRYNVGVSNLKDWNNLRDDHLHPGDKLRVSP